MYIWRMKKLISTIVMLVLAVAALSAAGKANMKFEATSHDFGTIKAKGGAVTATYKFVNDGDAPLVILDVTNGGCGCTTPTFPKAPIKPGESGEVKIHFNPAGRRGEFNREVKVRTNGAKKRLTLKFLGVIIP